MATAFFAGAFTSHQLEPHRFLKRGQLPGSCTPSSPIAQKTRDNSGTSPSNLLLRLRAKRQQRPETPVLISRIHTSSSHHAPLQCSDSAQTGSPPEITPSKDSWSRDPWQLNWVIWKPQRTDRRYAQSPPRCPPVLHTEGQRKQASRKARRGRY